ncbi:uncharacterized protein LOC134853100 [Symsagittifera roscoffensis]|uniref:uncharacterized protein LOC134853100 n=1 Tax=Symsagittifera roscoffensis TaxID=84072 RepID=UPI00307B8FC6
MNKFIPLSVLLSAFVSLSFEKDTIDFLCLTCEEDSSESKYTECCVNGLGLDYCCSQAEKAGEGIAKAAGSFLDAFGAGSNFYCTKNEDCTDGDEQFCCWGGDCCTTTEYMNEGIEAIFRSFGGYIIGSILLALVLLVIIGLCCSICCCICRK